MRCCILLLTLCLGSVPTAMSARPVAIIPQPRQLTLGEGEFRLPADLTVAVEPDEPAIRRALPLLSDLLRELDVAKVHVTPAGAPPAGAIFLGRLADAPVEDYQLDVTQGGVALRAGGQAGMVHAVMSLRQLAADGAIPAVHIDDGPRFAWRGLMLDCCRHFMSVAAIERVLDLMAEMKLNRFHWHLTEDQGWRLAIEKYPLLTEVGAWRLEPDGTRHGGYYTPDDVREVVAYAQDRGITVVPEIELPGHCRAALAAYPQLSCTGEAQPVPCTWGVFEDVYCAGNDEVFTFLTDVLGEVIDLFPGEEIHIGGDEAPKNRWRACPRCQARIESEGLSDESALQSWLTGRVGRWLAAHDRRLVGWDEILEGGDLPPGAIVQSWRGMDGAIAAARAGHDVVVSPTSHCYLDYDIGVTDLARCYGFEPVPPELSPDEARHVLGGEMNLWTEYCPENLVFDRLLPRVLALGEVLWSPAAPARDLAGFWRRVQAEYARLEARGIPHGPEARPLALQVDWDGPEDAWRLDAKITATVPGGTQIVQWRPEGRAAGLARTSGPVSVQLRIDGADYGAPAGCTLLRHLATGQPVTLTPAPSPKYPPRHSRSLTDGILGSTDYRDATWVAWEGLASVTGVLDLGAPRAVHGIRAVFLQDANRWIWLPREITVLGSRDGEQYVPLGTDTAHLDDRVQDRVTQDFTIVTADAPILRYLKIAITTRPACPDWHPGAGGPAWIFWGQWIVE